VLVSLAFDSLAAEWYRTLHPAKSINRDGSGVAVDSTMLTILLITAAVAGLICLLFVSERIRIGRIAVAKRQEREPLPVSSEVVRVG